MPETPATPKPRKARKSDKLRTDWPRIRRVNLKGVMYFRVDGRYMGTDSAGRPQQLGQQKHFKKLVDATAHANQLEEDRDRQTPELREFSEEKRVEYEDCMKILEPFQVTLRQACDAYVAARRVEEHKASSNTFQAAVEAFLTQKEAELRAGDIRDLTMKELRTRCKRFVEKFGERRLMEITPEECDDYLSGLPLAAQGRANERIKLGQVFNFAVRKRMLAANPLAGVQVKVPAKPVEVLTAGESQALLAVMVEPIFDQWLPYVLVGLFAGLRPREAKQLQWEHIHWDTKQLEIRAHTSKTGRITGHRFVPIEPALVRWLKPIAAKQGPIFQEKGFVYYFRIARVKAGLLHPDRGSGRGHKRNPGKWEDDILRHTYASFTLARDQNRTELAEHMGNTPEVIARRYRRALPKPEVTAFWKLTPPRNHGKQGVVLVG